MNIRSNALWLVGCRIGADLLSLLLFVMVSRRFGLQGTGAFSYGFALASLVSVIVTLGIDTYGVRQYVRSTPEQRPKLMAELLGTQATIVVASIAGLIVYLWVTGAATTTIEVIASLTCYQLAVSIARTLFIPAIAQERMIGPAVAELLCRGIAVGTAVAVIALHPVSLSGSLTGFPVAGIALMVIGAKSSLRHGSTLRIAASYSAVSRIGRTLFSFAAAEVAAQIFARIGLLTLAIQAGEEAAGLYAAGLKLLELACMPLVFLASAAYPRLIKLHETDAQEFQKLVTYLLWITVLMCGGIAWGLYFVAPAIAIPVLGANFVGTGPIVQAMAAVAIVQAAEAILWPILLAAGLQVARVAVIILATILSLVLNLTLVPLFGVYGAVIASFFSFTLIVVLFAVALRQALSARLLVSTFLSLSGGAVVAAAVTWALRDASIWIQMTVSFAVFVSWALMGYWSSRSALFRRRSADSKDLWARAKQDGQVR